MTRPNHCFVVVDHTNDFVALKNSKQLFDFLETKSNRYHLFDVQKDRADQSFLNEREIIDRLTSGQVVFLEREHVSGVYYRIKMFTL